MLVWLRETVLSVMKSYSIIKQDFEAVFLLCITIYWASIFTRAYSYAVDMNLLFLTLLKELVRRKKFSCQVNFKRYMNKYPKGEKRNPAPLEQRDYTYK